MYRYQIDNNFEKKIPNISVIYIPLNKKGFTDILSIDLEYTLKLNKAKNTINGINNNLWEDIKKYTNPYELIYVFNHNHNYRDSYRDSYSHLCRDSYSHLCRDSYSHRDNDRDRDNDDNIKSIAKIRPLSRSFFKMIEIIYEFIPIIFDVNSIINSLHIAEGPGGFIEATRYIRHNIHLASDDKAIGITLIDDYRKNVPAWKQSNIFLRNHPEVIISTGADGTGNIYNIDNILFLDTQIKKYCTTGTDTGTSNVINFITADGGFDYSIEYNYQEQASSKLLFSQIITALKYQKVGGDFVCKFFDINSYLTVEMLYILYLCYDKITIYKPFTSRIANSEKYIICNGYIGIDNIFLDNLFNILNEWNKNKLNTINQLFDELPILFIDTIKELNKLIINNQIQSINNIINIIKNKHNLNKIWKNIQIEKHTNNAKEWCAKYYIPYNE